MLSEGSLNGNSAQDILTDPHIENAETDRSLPRSIGAEQTPTLISLPRCARLSWPPKMMPILPPLRVSINATPTGHLIYLVTQGEHPSSVEGFANWFARRCRDAGVDAGLTAHPLRKLGAVRCVEAGTTEHELMALFGWSTVKQAALYTRKEPFGRGAERNQAVGHLFGERAGLGSLACHVDGCVDRTVGQPAVGREDLGETAVDVGNLAAQQGPDLRDMRAHAREAQGLLAHPRAAALRRPH
jgi:hypothetical protein